MKRIVVRGLVAAYLVAAVATFDVDLERLREGLGRAAAFVSGFLTPDFTTRWSDIRAGIAESIAMTIVATVLGVAASVPIAFGAARNLSPLPLYLVCRGLVVLGRGFQEVLVAVFFVALVGFGPLAGALTLSVAAVGFVGKLLAEEIEAIDPAPVEAVRATGGTWLAVVRHAVVPQVAPRFAGLSLYRLDINFRESAVVGVVGAGGIGATLHTAFDRYEYDVAGAILIVVLVLVFALELLAGRIRRSLT